MLANTIKTHANYIAGHSMPRVGSITVDGEKARVKKHRSSADDSTALPWKNSLDESAYSSSKVPESTATNTLLITNYKESCDVLDTSTTKKQQRLITNFPHESSMLNSNPTVVMERISIKNCFDESSRSKMSKINNNDHDTNMLVTSLKGKDEDETLYTIGQDVVVKNDGFFYAGRIIAVTNTRALVKFSDDTEQWTDFGCQMKKSECRPLHHPPNCIICCDTGSDDLVEECSVCFRSFHTKCSPDASGKYGSWYCGSCVRNKDIQVKRLRELLQTKVETVNRSELPYDLQMLTWNQQHTKNAEEIYCYCGQRGNWMLQMLQCSVCRQWFHEGCVNTLKYPIFMGDRFYIFVCGVCNSGSEFTRRLEIQWIDIVHILLFNLTLFHKCTFFDLNAIAPYARDNWHNLQVPLQMKALCVPEIRDQIGKILRENKHIFKCSNNKWGLIDWKPPAGPNIVLPQGYIVNEQYLKELFKDEAKLLFLPVIPNDHTPSEAKYRNLMLGKPYKSDSPDQKPIEHFEGCDQFEVESFHNIQKKTYFGDSDSDNKSIESVAIQDTISNNDESSTDFRYPNSRSEDRKRKRSATTLSSAAAVANRTNIEFDVADFPDDGRSLLDRLIPRPENFDGVNNPFYSIVMQDKRFSKLLKATKVKPDVKSEDQTMKRRLSSKDIEAAGCSDLKRRRIRSDTIDEDASTYVAINEVSNEADTSEPSPAISSEPVIVKNGRRLRQRPARSYFPPQRASTSKRSSSYNGGRLSAFPEGKIRGRRVDGNGEVSYLIDWNVEES